MSLNENELTLSHEFEGSKKKKSAILLLLATIGPGLTVMLADTDAGSIITSAQSGARWGYSLLWLQFLLIPILYFVQELTTRIGITTGKGHGELIKEKFGAGWAWFSVLTLVVSAIGALVTEFSGIASVGLLFGIPKWISISLASISLILITGFGRYTIVERIAIFIGLFELSFIPAVVLAHPDTSSIINGIIGQKPFYDESYRLLIAANVGAVIMPWMIFYQQGAVIDKKLTEKSIRFSRIDTAAGSVVTQVIMAVVLVLTAATIGRINPNVSLTNIQQIADSLIPFVGQVGGKILFSAGIIGASLIAAVVVSLATSWSLGEVMDFKRSLNSSWKEAPIFYGLYAAGIIVSAIIVLSGVPLVTLTISVEIMNSLLLPIVLGFLIALGWKALPEKYKLKNWEKIVLAIIYVLVCSLGILTLFQI
ncbi:MULTISPECIES: Nramp family divalent metal transporter [Thermoanaerobacterium]|uniref:NRAMP family metal ion transporter n=2 Tax=Thermoanaerobacterium TaxID=28895 RepID=W9EBP3_9THEO|nr:MULTISPECIES: Nramp family divalent metal transporter [Thermoanaerobacterium]AFK86332.1 metal ion transporter, NRAMP family [Thermoanaerobacterium saccharolyticum JW/SL-YS485]ETO39487.1 NRAMP family metal ion transporter [Thermoanaerobacterium aotearoense SCUT27]